MPPWSSFTQRLHEVVAARPAQTALFDPETGASDYATLWRQAGALAGLLREAGVRRGGLVALALGRSARHVVGVLAAWHAGAAFLPVDPCWPDERLRFLLDDARPTCALTAPGQADRFRRLGAHALPFPDLDGRAAPPAVGLTPGDLAYVIYTSGSTGRPKGVGVEHRGVVNLLDAQTSAFALAPDSRSLWLLHPAFDASVSDVGTTLLAGATLVVAGEEDPCDPAALTRRLHAGRITHLDLPPALLRVLDPEALPASLQTLIVGGEPSPPALLRRWAQRFRVVNVYGPTEATVCSSLCLCDPSAWDRPLLGLPLPGVSYHVLDDHLAPADVGELCIAGVGLARGYVNRPGLNATKFVSYRGERLYRTGDRVERRGRDYVFLGRIDRQVKVRGQLVEPEEVEAALRDHPRVAQAAVIKRPLGPPPAGEGLVAFLVADPPAPSLAEVRSFLASRLPAWMAPQRVVVRPDLPRLAGGKVDLAGLALLPLAGTDAPPAVSAEGAGAVLARIWAAVLGLPAVDPDAGFFEQGGDSLTLLQAVALAHAEGLTLPPALLAEGRGIAELADWLRAPANVPGAASAGELRADVDAVLAGLSFVPAAAPPGPAAVLLTGATGALGSALLAELLRRTPAKVVCPVRAPDEESARRRLEAVLREKEIHPPPDRVRAVAADLARPCFGLPEADWLQLAGEVGAVYHCAARVNLVLPYAALRPDNVLAAAEVLRFAGSVRPKRLHHASTLSVFVASDRNTGRLRESDVLDATGWVHGGYAQTKWAAEVLLRRGAGRTAGTVHYRLGLITPDGRTGRGAARDFLTLFLRGLARLGCLPPLDRGGLFLDATPIDFAAAALAHLSLHGGGDVFHLANARGLSLADIVAALAGAGVRLEEVSVGRWRDRLAELRQAEPAAAAACLALCRGLPGEESFSAYRTMDLFQATGVVFDMRRTHAALAGTGIACPPAPQLIRTYVAAALAAGGAPGGPR
jgi:amino acid adenylation domain-containing protein/thioester reductase-like protein